MLTNSLGMKLEKIPPGTFMMGADDGEADERPVHDVEITYPYYIGRYPVTNAQYEEFAPEHSRYRGKRDLSCEDDEAVLYVSWNEAEAYCEWLSEKEGKIYRLPTEAEWEYACRAGTRTRYHTGEELPESFHRNQENTWNPEPVTLQVGKTPPNSWGLYDMHGLVEEWCRDWYGPYQEGKVVDPVGCEVGDFKVTRGGSHNTDPFYLRAANRMGTLPQDKSWLIGFRVVQAPLPKAEPLSTERKLWAVNVGQSPKNWEDGRSADTPVFSGPLPYIHEPRNPEKDPLFGHNHCPSITWCNNGDLLAVWFSCESEAGREMKILGSRLRSGKQEWDPAAEFFNAPDRNMTGSSLFNDRGILYHFNGLEAAYGWSNLALVQRTSRDNGVTWSEPRLINANHQLRNQVISGTLKTREGFLIQPCDAVPGIRGGTALHVSRDGGSRWQDPGVGRPEPDFAAGERGAWIAGIHAGVVQLEDGRLMALGRENNIEGMMPMSISEDMGENWNYHKSCFPPLFSGQRLVLMRLREGPILFVSFTDSSQRVDAQDVRGLMMVDEEDNQRRGFGMFAALSFDEGKSWPVRKLVSPGGEAREYHGEPWLGTFIVDETHAEPKGYLAATQSPDGMIHLISSDYYYHFNFSWLKKPLD